MERVDAPLKKKENIKDKSDLEMHTKIPLEFCQFVFLPVPSSICLLVFDFLAACLSTCLSALQHILKLKS